MKKTIILSLTLIAAIFFTACSGEKEEPIIDETQPSETTEPVTMEPATTEPLEPDGEYIDFMPLTFLDIDLPEGKPPKGMVPSRTVYGENIHTVFGKKAKIVETIYSAYTGEQTKYYEFICVDDQSVFFSFTGEGMKLLGVNSFSDNAVIAEYSENGDTEVHLYMLMDGEIKTVELSALILGYISDEAYKLSFSENGFFSYSLPGEYEGGEVTVKCQYYITDTWLVIYEETVKTVEPNAPFDSDSEEWYTEIEFEDDSSYILRVNGPDGLSFEYDREKLGYDPYMTDITKELIVHPTLDYAALVYTGEMGGDMQFASTFCTVISLKNGEIIDRDRGIDLDNFDPDEMTCTYEYLKNIFEEQANYRTMWGFRHFAEPTEQGFDISISMLADDGDVAFGGLRRYFVLLRETGEVMFDYIKTETGTVTITGYIGEDSVILIPSSIEDCPVTAVADLGLREDQTVTYIRIPSSVTEIGPKAFISCSDAEKIVMADSVRSIGAEAFSGCAKLKKVTLSRGLISIGEAAFRDCVSLSDIDLPDGLITVGSRAFYGCSALKEIYIPAGVFDGNTFEMFMNSGIETVTFGKRVKSIDELAFSGTPIKEVILPDSVKKIGKGAFYGCGELTSVTLGKRIMRIGDLAFAGTAITDIVIPKIARYMNETVFFFCSALESVRFEGPAPENYLSDGGTDDIRPGCTVYYHPEREGFTFPEWNGYKCETW